MQYATCNINSFSNILFLDRPQLFYSLCHCYVMLYYVMLCLTSNTFAVLFVFTDCLFVMFTHLTVSFISVIRCCLVQCLYMYVFAFYPCSHCLIQLVFIHQLVYVLLENILIMLVLLTYHLQRIMPQLY